MPLGRDGDLPLEILVAIAAQFARVIEDLSDHLTARLRITPELAFHDHQSTALISEDNIDKADARDIQFPGNSEHPAKAWIERVHRQYPGLVVDKVAQDLLASGEALRHAIDHLGGTSTCVYKYKRHPPSRTEAMSTIGDTKQCLFSAVGQRNNVTYRL